MKPKLILPLALLPLSVVLTSAAELADGVRGVATRAPKEMKIDGDLAEFRGAFCTPLEYHNGNLKERAAGTSIDRDRSRKAWRHARAD